MTTAPVPHEDLRRTADILREAILHAKRASSATVSIPQEGAAAILSVLEGADAEYERRDRAAAALAEFSNSIGFVE
ncbi:hypothetical protein FPH17_07210 [Corynebacterium godavarianum]|uniref:Uncharacterized protein n=1 Tax=Corynebacterium godavarianum TaxID=2054421 RepID=A0ABY3E266_9CORY|nr:hypothetical protein [Corynebacterium godavarianum]MBL7286775.1 hypothetical protein [Corynebacterium godavarianum]TSJ73693.1 hypothetical protein FPH17_07210 [Corynebacterium godavarianum]